MENTEDVENIDTETFDVMISYAWLKEKDVVLSIAKFLRDNELKVWIDEKQILGGQILDKKIVEGLTNSTVFIACLSKEYNDSVNCQKELNYAVYTLKKKIIPILLGETNTFAVAGHVYIPFYDVNGDILKDNEFKQKLNELLQAVKNMLGTRMDAISSNVKRSDSATMDAQQCSDDNADEFKSESSLYLPSPPNSPLPYSPPIDRNDTSDENKELNELEIEIEKIKEQPLTNLPGKNSTITQQMNTSSSSLDLIGIWLRDLELHGYELTNAEVINILNAEHGGGDPALLFFEIFKIRKADRPISFLLQILKKKEEYFSKAIELLKTKEKQLISTLTLNDLMKLAEFTTFIGLSNTLLDWKYIADKSKLTECMDFCRSSRKTPGVDGKASAMFSIVEEKFPDYTVREFLTVFEEHGSTNAFARKIMKEVEESATDEIEDRKLLEKHKKKSSTTSISTEGIDDLDFKAASALADRLKKLKS